MGIGQAIHDIAWSFQQGKLHELFLHDGITFGTWGLVLVTLLLVLDSWRSGKNQQRRWDRDDARQLASDGPKYRFGLKLSIPKLPSNPNISSRYTVSAYLWIANLGKFGLYVDRMYVRHRAFGEASLEVNRIVATGQEIEFELPHSFFQEIPGIKTPRDGNYLYGDHEVWLDLADANGTFETDRVLYQMIYMQHSFDELKRGSYENRQPVCPKCGLLLNAELPATGLLSEQEVQSKFWQPILVDLTKTCPDHASSLLEWKENPVPPWITGFANGADNA